MQKLSTIWMLILVSYRLAGQAPVAELSAADMKEIRTEARKIIEVQLKDLLNTIADEALTEHQRDAVIFNSYLTSQNKIFYDGQAIVQDDVNPDNTYAKKGPELNVRKYLDNFKLYYGRSGSESVKISEVFVGEVEQKAYPFVKVRFKVHFANTHRQKKKKYVAVYRVAELRAEKPDKQWIVQISNIRYFIPPAITATDTNTIARSDAAAKDKPAEGAKIAKTDTAALPKIDNVPVNIPVAATQPEIKKQEPVAKLLEMQQDKPVSQEIKPATTPEEKPVEAIPEKPKDITIRQKQLPRTVPAQSSLAALEKKERQSRTNANLLRVTALAAIAGSAANFLILNNSFNQYRQQIYDQNAELNTWWNTSSGAGKINGSGFGELNNYRATPVSFMEFTKPGIYFSAGGLVAGGILWFLSSKPNKQAKQYRKQIEEKRKKLSVTPQWNPGTRYAGIQLIYPF